MKLYEGVFTEYNGEQEYSHSVLVHAKTGQSAEKKILKWMKHWYEDEDVEPYENIGWEFFGGQIIISLESVNETTKQAFMENAYRRAIDEPMPLTVSGLIDAVEVVE